MRADILAEYDVDERGVIRNPGKFEAEPCYVPYFWEMTMDGSAETMVWTDESSSYVVEIGDIDKMEWPELPADCAALHMSESDQGFVFCETLTAAELADLESRNAAEWEDQEEDSDNE
jgi:hypothetical protein